MRSQYLAILAAGMLAACAACEKSPAPVASQTPPPTAPRKVGTVQIRYDERPSVLLEPELGELTAPMQVYEDAAAAGGKYVLAPEGPNHKEISKGGSVLVRFNVPAEGDYAVWFRAHWCCSCGNSLGLMLDGKEIGTVEDATYQKWHWVPLRAGMPPKIAAISLKAGEHDLVITNREDGSALDQVLLTQDMEYRPAEMEKDGVRGRTMGVSAGARPTPPTIPATTTTTVKP